jgi:hypothetical protein
MARRRLLALQRVERIAGSVGRCGEALLWVGTRRDGSHGSRHWRVAREGGSPLWPGAGLGFAGSGRRAPEMIAPDMI